MYVPLAGVSARSNFQLTLRRVDWWRILLPLSSRLRRASPRRYCKSPGRPRGWACGADVAQNPADTVVIDHTRRLHAPSRVTFCRGVANLVLSIDSEPRLCRDCDCRKEEMAQRSPFKFWGYCFHVLMVGWRIIGRRCRHDKILRLHWRKSRVYPFMEQAFMGRMRNMLSTDRIECF